MINSALCTWVKNEKQTMKAESRVKIKAASLGSFPSLKQGQTYGNPEKKKKNGGGAGPPLLARSCLREQFITSHLG